MQGNSKKNEQAKALLLSPASAGKADRLAYENGIDPQNLMQNAGKACFAAIEQRWSDRAYLPIILCGPGNNGGDGFVIARAMQEAGYKPRVFAIGNGGSPERQRMRALWLENGGSIEEFRSDGLSKLLKEGCLIIDAIFGAGLDRDISGDIAHIIQEINERAMPVASVDLPSGLCGRTGNILGQAFKSTLTITFERKKHGHMLGKGMSRCGELLVAPIGIPQEVFKQIDKPVYENLPHMFDFCLEKSVHGHKYSYGSALVCAGGKGQAGAARLAARAALRMGAGLVTLLCSRNSLTENASQLNAIMLQQVDKPQDYANKLDDRRVTALLVGPGFGLTKTRKLAMDAILNLAPRSSQTLILDADALSLLATAASKTIGKLKNRPTILTPHMGEFARLFPKITNKMRSEQGYSKIDAALEAANMTGSIILLKGADTVIASADGRCFVDSACRERAAPWLATAGAGDVLAGFVTGLAARGADAMIAASLAVWLHGECARAFGPGLIAEDLPEILPQILARLKNDHS